ncbi:hypothetical protein [Zobellella sp. DQSA1]|uniref:hypothetical protein n=1 Tax=Zobellella sp. DQSA1 TaxID=3342386 RepID=UPI0035C1C5BF
MITEHGLRTDIGLGNMAKYKVKVLDGVVYLQAPARIDVYRDDLRDSTLTFLAVIAHLGLNWEVRIRVDLKGCETITAAAAVMLFAEVTRIQLATNDSEAVLVDPPEGPFRVLFRNSGLQAGLKPGAARKLNELFDNDHPLQSGDTPAKSIISIMSVMHKAGLDLTKPQTRIFSKGVQEAMLNVMHHAYRHEAEPLSGIGKRWWHACWYNPQDNSMSFIIYDKGSGIPETLAEVCGPEMSDEDRIAHGLKKGVTCMLDPSRGKGSVDIQNVTNIYAGSLLFVASNYGIVLVKDDGEISTKKPSNQSFNGTLIEWKFKLEVNDEEV